VANVEYRMGPTALAPAAVEDCRCALRWVRENAATYKLDTARIVLTGHSAGGHLSLTTGMLGAASGFDNLCPKRNTNAAAGGLADPVVEEMPVAAIVNWFGITDVADLLSGPHAKVYAIQWMGSLPNRAELAEQLSPLSMVRPGLPAILTIHGDADPIVPYDHALRLRAALDKAGVPNQLHTVSGGGHGGFTVEQTLEAYQVIREFLAKHVPAPSS
jgi:acetyl esterase/lipase